MERGVRAWVLLLVLGAAGGCGRDEDPALRERIEELERQVAATATTAPTSSTSPAPATTVTSAPAATATTAGAPRPVAVEPKQGDRVFAVFVATGATGRAESFPAAKARLTTLGYRTFSEGETTCSQGAKEALPQLQDISLSVEFATRADADRFTQLYGPTLGTAAVTVFCAD